MKEMRKLVVKFVKELEKKADGVPLSERDDRYHAIMEAASIARILTYEYTWILKIGLLCSIRKLKSSVHGFNRKSLRKLD